MSLLLEALKKAEKAKEEAQKRAREEAGQPEGSEELRLAEEAPVPAEERRVVTRDELPSITTPLEIQSEDIGGGAPQGGAAELSLQGAPRPAPESPPRPRPEAQAAQRAAARAPFEAKMREPNPRLPFYITMGALGVACVATAVYFYFQLSAPRSIYNANPKPPSGEVAVVTPPPAQAVAGVNTTSGAIPGLPSVEPRPAEAAPPAVQPPAPATVAPRPAPREASPKPRARPPVVARAAPPAQPVRPSVSHSRSAARVHPLVDSGYAAYQAGDMQRARREYQAALREEPANRDALLGMAAVETRMQRREAAESLYRRLLEADPRDPHAQAGLLGLRAAEVSPVTAESHLKSLIANDSAESVLYFSLGNQFAQQGRWPEAQQAYARASAISPHNPDFAYNHAISLEHVKQPVAAVRQYRQALALALQRTASFDPAAAQQRVQALSR